MKFLLILLVVFISGGCIKKDGSITLLEFDISTENQIMLSEISDDVIEIKPDTNILFKSIRQIEVFENFLLIRDIESQVNVFDMGGNFVRPIGKRGQGPGEYTLCTGLCFDMSNKHILLKTNVGIMIYDIAGNFINKIPERPNAFFYANGFYYSVEEKFSNDGGKYYQDTHLSIYDNDYKNITTSLRNRYETSMLRLQVRGLNKPVFQDEENTYFFLSRYATLSKQDTVYHINNHQISPFLDIKLTHAKKDDGLRDVFISGRYVVVKYITDIPIESSFYLSHCIYDNKTKKAKNSRRGFIDDIYHRGNVIIEPLLQQGMFYYIKEEEYSDELKMEPNPSIYIGRFKEN